MHLGLWFSFCCMSGAHRHRFYRQTIALAVALVLLVPEAGWSWGWLGHRVSTRFAESHLTPAALAAVRNLLGSGVTLADAANWADEQREPAEILSWHYVNVPITESLYNARFCPASGCVISKIEDFRRVLLDPKRNFPERQQALKFLIHFIEDLHQPLHVGDTGSRGGNLLQVRFFGEGSNLHHVWDTLIIERHSRNEQVWLWELNGLANPGKIVEWSRGTQEDWASEMLADAKIAYRKRSGEAPLRPGARLGRDYCNFTLPIIERELAQAGVRVAFVLNGIFK